MEAKEDGIESVESDGILLYYKYAQIPDVAGLVGFYESNCKSLGLLGRVRIGPDGVNVTVGGKLSSLDKHIEVMKCDRLFEGTDFKLASCDGPSDERIARECGFTDLSVRVVKELVTFRSDPMFKSPEISHAGRHLSATEFHSVLQDAEKSSDSYASLQQRQLLLLDARNLYETRIGKFQNPYVETLDPEIRQYSDLPDWIDEHSEQLHGKHVLMYCTGGIRCEMASAYIRSKGSGYENVFQLYGGIQRYLEQFPDGGFFKGKNFVFDHRVSVGSQDTDIVGACLLCGTSFDDYSSRCRCTYCRMLVLVCYSCQGKGTAGYVCELCKKHRNEGRPLLSTKDAQLHSCDSLDVAEVESTLPSVHAAPFPVISGTCGNGHHRKLRILCLHGFRQNASNFKGRTSSLAKKLKNMAEFVFVDAPHGLPFIYQTTNRTAPHQQAPPSVDKCKKRFAWLVSSKSSSDESDWRVVEEPFDALQYRQQADGFDESYNFLKDVISQLGPFDGILGFSQGAAMAASLLEQQQRTSGRRDFRFAVLCSGFPAASENFGREVVKCPSLHVFGDGRGRDRQIDGNASRKLAALFDKGCSVIIEHDMGHIIPTQSPYIDQMKGFLWRFL